MDGDGLITIYDMKYFVTEQLNCIESSKKEPAKIKNILCELLDMIKPNMHPPVIRRRDLKRSGMTAKFFNLLVYFDKFSANEEGRNRPATQEGASSHPTEWDRFAASAYLLIIGRR